MVETVVAGILDAARISSWEQCRARRDEALQMLLDRAADQRHTKVKSLTNTIMEIDRFLRALDCQIAVMPIDARQKERTRVMVSTPFLRTRQELVRQKRLAAVGKDQIAN